MSWKVAKRRAEQEAYELRRRIVALRKQGTVSVLEECEIATGAMGAGSGPYVKESVWWRWKRRRRNRRRILWPQIGWLATYVGLLGIGLLGWWATK